MRGALTLGASTCSTSLSVPQPVRFRVPWAAPRQGGRGTGQFEYQAVVAGHLVGEDVGLTQALTSISSSIAVVVSVDGSARGSSVIYLTARYWLGGVRPGDRE